MLNPKLWRESPDMVKQSLANRGVPDEVFESLMALDHSWRTQQMALESLQATRNQSIPKGKPTDEQRQQLAQLSKQIKDLQDEVAQIKQSLTDVSMEIPNILQPDTPIGTDDTCNPIRHTHGTPPSFSFTPKSHDELAVNLGIIDFENASKITGSRFAIFKGLGAKLERAVATFMLDTHTQRFGYTELSPPVIVHTDSLKGTGQLPKFSDDQYQLGDDFWLSPTAEVQLTNYHRDEILAIDDLPRRYCAFTPCFRKEAGSYGKDMKGLIRLHQFNKVELVQFCTPETSNQYLTELLSHAGTILQALDLPYRVVELCSGDLGFSASKTYDIEVWLPSQNQYREISSCSNFLDFQARRAKIRYRDHQDEVHYIHTLNGSGLAVGRTIAAILENYQDVSGIIKVPEVLQDYMGLKEIR